MKIKDDLSCLLTRFALKLSADERQQNKRNQKEHEQHIFEQRFPRPDNRDNIEGNNGSGKSNQRIEQREKILSMENIN